MMSHQLKSDESSSQKGTGEIRKIVSPAERSVGDVGFGNYVANAKHRSGNAVVSRPPEKVPPTQKDPRKLFVGGLPTDITEEAFRLFFEKFGVLIDFVVMVDRDTGRSRGFGFITYDDPAVSQSILRMGGGVDGIGRLEMRGKICEVKAAQPKEPGSRPRNSHKNAYGRAHMMAGPSYPYPYHAFVPSHAGFVPAGITFQDWSQGAVLSGYAPTPVYYPVMQGGGGYFGGGASLNALVTRTLEATSQGTGFSHPMESPSQYHWSIQHVAP